MRLLRLRTVLVATDLSKSSDAALDSGARLASASGATLHVVHVVSEPDTILVNTGKSPKLEEEVLRALDRARVPPGNHKVHILPGDPKTTIGPLAEASNADVIVMGRHREGTILRKNHPVGGTAYAVITTTTIPCLVVTRPLALPIERALVAVDETETALGALVVAISWASALRKRASSAEPTLTALQIRVGAPGALPARGRIDQELDALRRDGGSWAGVTVLGVALNDPDTVAAITRYATEHDPELVVLGTRALGSPTDPTLGSVAAAVTRHLTLPVLLVPPAVWRDYARDLDTKGAHHEGLSDEHRAGDTEERGFPARAVHRTQHAARIDDAEAGRRDRPGNS